MMASETDPSRQPDPEADEYIQGLLRRAAGIRLPEFFQTRHPDALYHLSNRGGVSVVALRTTALTEDQLVSILTYRLAQYVAINFVDPSVVYQRRLTHEPLTSTSPSEIHIIAGSADTGEILCYLAVKGAITAAPDLTLRTRERPLFPAEELFGWGIFNRLRILPDLRVAKVREIGRFVKNQQRSKTDELLARAPVEVCAALFKLASGPLRQEVDAYLGDFEEEVAKRNIEFFHVPLVVLHGVVPYSGKQAYLREHVQASAVYPFAIFASDASLAVERLAAVEAALALPGREGLRALISLKADVAACSRSSLEPSEGLTPLNEVVLPQERTEMEVRRQWLDAGDALRKADPFSSLSGAEAAVLATLMERVKAQPEALIVRQGDIGDALYLIESGEAEVQATKADGTRTTVAVMGPGSFFGEIALVTDTERTANVVAKTPMRLLRLGREVYRSYLSGLVDVDSKFSRMGLEKAQEQLRKLKSLPT
jgi:hypothetical protein